jgi:acylphosphatase
VSARIAKRIVVTGRVQGVGFRYALADEARSRGLSGWVRNCRDGSVEAILYGPAADVAALVGWARRGPPAAKVESVEVEDTHGEFEGFEITH